MAGGLSNYYGVVVKCINPAGCSSEATIEFSIYTGAFAKIEMIVPPPASGEMVAKSDSSISEPGYNSASVTATLNGDKFGNILYECGVKPACGPAPYGGGKPPATPTP